MKAQEQIDELAKFILEKIQGATLFGEEVDLSNINALVVAAYFVGFEERNNKKWIDLI